MKKHRENRACIKSSLKVGTKSYRDLGCEKGLRKLQLPGRAERRGRGDVIMMFKCVEGREKINVSEYLITQSVIHERTYQKVTQEKAKELC